MNKNIWVSSDPHWMHRNIAGPKVSKWGGGYRDFENEIIMSEHIVKVWNQTMKEDDVLYCLGDWSFGGVENIWNFRKQLRVKEIHLIVGNHDEKIVENKTLPNCFWNTTQQQIKYTDGSYSRDTEEVNTSLTSDETSTNAKAKDVFSSVQDVLSVSHGKHNFFLSHYSHRVWDSSHKGVIHLYGHSHDSIDKNGEYWGKSMDVGVDSAKRILGEYRPFSIEEIINKMDKRDIKAIDHHK